MIMYVYRRLVNQSNVKFYEVVAKGDAIPIVLQVCIHCGSIAESMYFYVLQKITVRSLARHFVE